MKDANLYKANLREAYLREAYLYEANLSGANLSLTFLSGANLRGAYLSEVLGLNIEQLSKVKTLYKAKLDPELKKQVEDEYPHLLEEPKSEE